MALNNNIPGITTRDGEEVYLGGGGLSRSTIAHVAPGLVSYYMYQLVLYVYGSQPAATSLVIGISLALLALLLATAPCSYYI